jgi:hypothetical protein
MDIVASVTAILNFLEIAPQCFCAVRMDIDGLIVTISVTYRTEIAEGVKKRVQDVEIDVCDPARSPALFLYARHASTFRRLSSVIADSSSSQDDQICIKMTVDNHACQQWSWTAQGIDCALIAIATDLQLLSDKSRFPRPCRRCLLPCILPDMNIEASLYDLPGPMNHYGYCDVCRKLAANKIVAYVKKCLCDPSTRICRRRLLREYDELVRDL